MEEKNTTENVPENISSAKPLKKEITIEEFDKLDIRICRIISVEEIEKSDKLYKLLIDTGIDQRIVVSAIREFFNKEDLIESFLPFVLNLKPRKIRGIESFGMLIASESVVSKSFIGLIPLPSSENLYEEDTSDEKLNNDLTGAIVI